jgi:hypothetical protein
MTAEKTIRIGEAPRSLAPRGRAGARRLRAVQTAPGATIREAGGVEPEQVRDLLEHVERIAGWLRHAAEVGDSIAAEEFLAQESQDFAAARQQAIGRGLSDVIAFYGVELRSSVELFRRRNAAELQAD